jgi:hypothetical protein
VGRFGGDFMSERISGHEGRTSGQRLVNVDSWRFHEGRGAGKSTTPGGHIIVSRKKIV